eukprot:COSAG06_NODE_14106_length_1189_cov_33.891743_2_plen_233_part_00
MGSWFSWQFPRLTCSVCVYSTPASLHRSRALRRSRVRTSSCETFISLITTRQRPAGCLRASGLCVLLLNCCSDFDARASAAPPRGTESGKPAAGALCLPRRALISKAQIPQCDYVSKRWLIAKVIAWMIRRGEKLDPVHVLWVMYQPSYHDLIRLASLNLSQKCGDAFSDAYKAEVTMLEAILTKTTSDSLTLEFMPKPEAGEDWVNMVIKSKRKSTENTAQSRQRREYSAE